MVLGVQLTVGLNECKGRSPAKWFSDSVYVPGYVSRNKRMRRSGHQKGLPVLLTLQTRTSCSLEWRMEASVSVMAQRKTSACLLLAPVLPQCPSAVTYRARKRLGKMVFPRKSIWLAESKMSVSFAVGAVGALILEVALQPNAGEGTCVVGCWGPRVVLAWGEDEVGKMRKIQVVGELLSKWDGETSGSWK